MLLAVQPSVAAEPVAAQGRGPFEVREEWLLTQSSLTLPAVGPTRLAPGRYRLRVALDWGNDLGWRQDVAGEEPNDRLFLVDGEHRTLEAELTRGVAHGFEVGLRVPLRWRGGGVLDDIIDTFHGFTRALGLPDNGRRSFATHRLRALGRDASGRAIAWDGGPGTGFGNVELALRWTAARAAHASAWTFAGLLALPSGTGPFAASGIELGGQAALAWPLGARTDIYADIGATYRSDADAGGIAYAPVRGFGHLTFEWRPWPSWSVLAELAGASRSVRSFASYPGFQSYLRLGAKVDVSGRSVLELGFSENLFGQQATTDFSVFASVRHSF